MNERQIPGAEIASILAQARGRENALTSAEIAWRIRRKDVFVDARTVRRVIAELQTKWNFLVCAAPGGGYFVPADFDEVRAYYLFLSTLERSAIEKRRRYRAQAEKLGYRLAA